MRAQGFWAGGAQAVILSIMVAAAGPAHAGFLDDIGEAIEETGKSVSDGVKKAGEDAGIVEGDSSPPAAAASAKLPGGVSNRLKKMHQEMDKAERSLEKGAGTAVDRAKRAEQNLKRARGFKGEIEKRYTGQYSEDHPDVVEAFGRLARLEAGVKSAGQDAAATEDAKRQAQETEEAAAAKARADRETDEKAQAESAASSRQQAEEECESWRARMYVYTDGDKAMYRCVAANDDAMPACKTTYDEAVVLTDKFKQTSLAAEPCGAVRSVLSDLSRYMENFMVAYDRYDKKQTAAKANLGEIVFSKSPIDPQKPSELTRQFEAGDRIYGLIKVTKPWSAIYNNNNSANVMVGVKLDGKKIHAQFVNLKKPELVQRKYIVFEIAPDPRKMTAYSNPDIEYGKSTATMRQGPNELTHHLGQLGTGRHTMKFEIQYYGTIWAAGEFAIEGKDFKKYAELHTKIADGVAQSVTLPAAKKVDKKMAAEMKALLENAGWSKIHRINIVDKDWWIDRTSGGNSPVKSRHIAAAALAKGGDGKYYYKMCTFHQDKLITGGFGKLYLSHQGDKVPIPQENIDR